MIQNRRAVVVSAASVLFVLSSVAAAAVAPVAPESEFNALGQQVGVISAAVGNQDMSKAAEGLNGLFNGSLSKKDSAGSGSVVAGEWRIAPRQSLATSRPEASYRRDVPAGLLTLRGDEEKQAKFITVGVKEDAALALALAIAEKILRDAEEAARRYAERDQTEESKKKYGGCRMDNSCPK